MLFVYNWCKVSPRNQKVISQSISKVLKNLKITTERAVRKKPNI